MRIKSLYILTKVNDALSDELISKENNGTVVLVQDAVYRRPSTQWAVPVYAVDEDHNVRGSGLDHSLVSMDELITMIETHERVVVL